MTGCVENRIFMKIWKFAPIVIDPTKHDEYDAFLSITLIVMGLLVYRKRKMCLEFLRFLRVWKFFFGVVVLENFTCYHCRLLLPWLNWDLCGGNFWWMISRKWINAHGKRTRVERKLEERKTRFVSFLAKKFPKKKNGCFSRCICCWSTNLFITLRLTVLSHIKFWNSFKKGLHIHIIQINTP